MLLGDLFEIKNGLASSEVKISQHRTETHNLLYVRPSSTYDNLNAGYLNREEISSQHIFPEGTLFVSTDGQGSHSYAYVSGCEFIPNSNVAVLLPKIAMSNNEKIFYALCITANRYKFSYGRKPKGDRLKILSLPDVVPVFVHSIDLDKYTAVFDSSLQPQAPTVSLSTSEWRTFRYDELFDIRKGQRITKKQMKKGDIPCIRPIDSNNGVIGYIEIEPNHPGNVLTVNYNGSGVAEAFYQPKPIFALDDVNVLYPKFCLTPSIALFITTLIRKEKYRFNYGRKWHVERMNKSIIKLPATSEGVPDWRFMENYIKSLPLASEIEE